jgi:hypothetical protein
VCASPGRKLLPPRQEGNDWPTGPARPCIGVKLQGLHSAPPSNLTGGGGGGGLTGHCIVRRRSGIEPGKVWLRSFQDWEQKGPILAGDQRSCQGHQCRETSLTGEPGSIVSVDTSLGLELLPADPPRREANIWPTGPVRLCIGVKLLGLHKAIVLHI